MFLTLQLLFYQCSFPCLFLSWNLCSAENCEFSMLRSHVWVFMCAFVCLWNFIMSAKAVYYTVDYGCKSTRWGKKPGPLFFTARIFKMPAPICVICWRTSMSVNQIYTKICATWQRSETPMLPLTTPVLRHEALCHNDIQTRGISEWWRHLECILWQNSKDTKQVFKMTQWCSCSQFSITFGL